MAQISNRQRTQWMCKLLNQADHAVAGLPELQSLWNKIRQTVVDQVGGVPPSKYATTKWPPLFLWLYRYPGEANTLEEALTAVNRCAGQVEFKQACHELIGKTQPEQAYSRIIELVIIGRGLDRSVASTVLLHPRVAPQSRRRADMSVMVGNKRVYVEVTVLFPKGDPFRNGPRSGYRACYPCRDGARILGKILDKVAPRLDPGRSQLSATEANALVVSLAPSAEEAYDGAIEWALGALDVFPERVYEAVAKRNGQRKVPLSHTEIGQVIDAFSKISCVIVFRGCVFWKVWWRERGPLSLTDGELRHLLALFRETNS